MSTATATTCTHIPTPIRRAAHGHPHGLKPSTEFVLSSRGNPTRMNRRMLGIYLNDHLAGSVMGSRLAKRIVRQNEDNDYGRKVARIAREIEEDQGDPARADGPPGIGRSSVPGWRWPGSTEKAMRLKPNGNLVRYSPLSRVLELETLTMGITGKLELWRSLETLDGGPSLGVNFASLAARAEDQRDRVEDLRVRAAREALGG